MLGSYASTRVHDIVGAPTIQATAMQYVSTSHVYDKQQYYAYSHYPGR